MPGSQNHNVAPVLFVSHGGGPLPLLGDPSHREMVELLHRISALLPTPEAILVISAHWEADSATLTSDPHPRLLYDYYGFPEEAYRIQYPAPGAPDLAGKISDLLSQQGIKNQLDPQRGFDHGLFVPLKLLFPEADIPCLQLSLLNSLDPQTHLQLGEAISKLRQHNVLILGSGFTFHNMRAFFTPGSPEHQQQNLAFESWLLETLGNSDMPEKQRRQRLLEWQQAPGARYCHPREEHLLPLHVCYGCAGRAADQIFSMTILGKAASCFLWQ